MVSHSSTESEYRGLANSTAELCWIEFVLRELHLPVSWPLIFYCDNLSATYLATNPVLHAHTKHAEIDYHFVCERVANGSLVVQFTPLKDRLTDVMTKALPSCHFLNLCSKLIVLTRLVSLRGNVKS